MSTAVLLPVVSLCICVLVELEYGAHIAQPFATSVEREDFISKFNIEIVDALMLSSLRKGHGVGIGSILVCSPSSIDQSCLSGY